MKTLFGSSDPLGPSQEEWDSAANNLRRLNQYQSAMMQAQQAAMNIQSQGRYSDPHTDAFLMGLKAGVRSATRDHIANEVEKMAEEIGAPTLLHAVVLAIRTMEIPE